MCNRYDLHADAAEIAERFSAQVLGLEYNASYNICPTDTVPAVIVENGERVLREMRWGLVPFFAKPVETGAIPKGPNNARAETLAESAMFRSLLNSGRCILPANGFYEWSGPKGAKQAWYFSLPQGELFGFAGLWSTWKRPDGSRLFSCTTVTTTPNDLCATVHDRMPVILLPEREADWLSGEIEPTEMPSILAPYPAELMSKRAVGTGLTDVRYKGPACLDACMTLL